MSHVFECGENAALVGYVYGECDPRERQAIDKHVAGCVACAAELASLRSTRESLTNWAPPEEGLGFQIVRSTRSLPETRETQPPEGGGSEARSWYARPVPVWTQAVAAALIFAAGATLGVVRGIAPTTEVPGAAPISVVDDAASISDLEALERRLRAEISRIPVATALVDEVAPAASEEQILGRVRTLIEESERRQQRELALRTAQVVRDFDSQRQADLAQIQSSFGQIEGLTGAEVREQRQMLDYLIRVSQQR
jgi:hypothetical protein